jgi:hypothetical protein
MITAHTQYGDVLGTAAADFHQGGGLHELATAAGIDTKAYFPVGLRLTGTDNRIEAILVIEMDEIENKTFDGVRDFIAANPGKARSIAFAVDEELDLAHYFKQFDVVLASKGMGLENVEFTDAD